jgi:dipeptidyl aminopeptidase/acylaminoacyl peptidase
MFVGGCSGGGVLSSWVIGHTTRFAAAAVRCPVIDWISMAGETDIPLFTFGWFDAPYWEKPEAWLKESPLMYVGHVTTPTLIMTGELDRRTPMPQSEESFTSPSRCGTSPPRCCGSTASITGLAARSRRTFCAPSSI